MTTPTKTCSKCGKTYPATTEYFHKHKTKDGLRSDCKACRSAYHKKWRGQHKDQPIDRDEKTCPRCSRTLPLTDENFSHNQGTGDGYHGYCKQCRSKRRTTLYKQSPELRQQVKQRASNWYYANYEKAQQNRKRQYWENREEAIKRSREWREANPERYRAAMKRYKHQHYRDNREQYNSYVRKRRAIKAKVEGEHTADDIAQLYIDQAGECAYCGRSLDDGFHVDHIIPLSRGGSNWPSNLALACAPCNLSKGDRLLSEWHPID